MKIMGRPVMASALWDLSRSFWGISFRFLYADVIKSKTRAWKAVHKTHPFSERVRGKHQYALQLREQFQAEGEVWPRSLYHRRCWDGWLSSLVDTAWHFRNRLMFRPPKQIATLMQPIGNRLLFTQSWHTILISDFSATRYILIYK